jgi:hypothetical protein
LRSVELAKKTDKPREAVTAAYTRGFQAGWTAATETAAILVEDERGDIYSKLLAGAIRAKYI